MADERNFFDKFSAVMDQNIKGVQYGVYTVAGLGFILAMRSVRPFKKFQIPRDIPGHFIKKQMRFNGKVVNIRGDKLILDHHPILPIPFRPKSEGLPIKVSGINITPNAGIWLNSIVRDQEVTFTPLRKDGDAAECIVQCKNRKDDVGQHLVSIGFATVAPYDLELDKNQTYSKYYKSLLASERKAENKGAGIWYERDVGLYKKFLNMLPNIPKLRPIL